MALHKGFSPIAVVFIVFVLVAAVAGGLFILNNKPATKMTQPVYSIPSSTSQVKPTSYPSTTHPPTTSNTDTGIQQDLSSIDSKIKSLNSNSTNINSALNDKSVAGNP